MRKTFLYPLLFIVLLGCGTITSDPIKQLSDMVAVLNQAPSFKYMAYHHIRQEGAYIRDTTSVTIYKSSKDLRLPLQYVFESSSGDIQLFDGQQFKNINHAERTIIYTENPPDYLIVSNQGLLFSPFYIQSYLNYVLENDKNAITYLGDTLVNNKKARQYRITTNYIYLLDGNIVRNGDVLPNQVKAQNIQKKHLLTIDAASNYPIAIKEFFGETDFTEVVFSFKEQALNSFEQRAQSLENEKYLTLSMEDYMQIQMSKQQEKIGTKAEDFTLPLFPETTLTLSELKGSPVLLEFWFPGCAFCIKAVPSVNNIFETYQNKGLQVIGIEFSNASNVRISNYIEKYQVKYPTVYNGKSLSLKYGVNSGPTFILLDKNHQVVYSQSGIDETTLKAAIEKVL